MSEIFDSVNVNASTIEFFYNSSFSVKSWQNPASLLVDQWRIQDFPEEAGANSGGGEPTYYLAKISRKLHENEEILAQMEGEGARPTRQALDPSL